MMKIGVMVHLMDDNIDERFKQVREYGFDWCQLCAWNHDLYTEEIAQKIDEARKKYNVEISTFWCGYSGPVHWNFYEGQNDLGKYKYSLFYISTCEYKNKKRWRYFIFL